MTTANLALPQVTVEIAGRQLSDIEMNAIGAIRIQRRLSLPAQCEIRFHDLSDEQSPLSPGIAGLSFQVSGVDGTQILFRGEVTAVEYGYDAARGATLRVRGYDRLQRLRKRQSSRTHVQVGLGDLAQDLVQDLGIVVEPPRSDVLWRHIIQHGLSDFDLLAQRSAECGCYFALEENTLRFFTLEGDDESVPLQLGGSLFEARIEVNGDSTCGEVRSVGWDPLRVKMFTATAGLARSGREVAARIAPEFGTATVTRVLSGRALHDDRQAEAIAQAELDRRAAREVTLWGVAGGNAQLRPGTPVDVSGVARAVAGRFVLTQVTHLFDHEHGFVTEFNTMPPEPAPGARGVSLILGVVTRVNDPDKLGRVKVSLPASGDQETDWMQVLTPGAGAGKGIIALPDVNDTVMVLCLDDDPAQGIVLGGVYGAGGAPDSGVDGEAVKRFTLVTPGGQKLRFDDEHKSIRVENKGGSYLELRPGKVTLHAATDLSIEALGHTITVRGKAINFEEA